MRPMSTTFQRISAAATVLLVLAIIAVLALRSFGVPLALGPAATPEPTQAGSPGPSASEDPMAVFAQIEGEVRQIRGLPAAEIGPPELLSRADLSAELQRIFARDYPADERAADNAVLRALGLLSADQDIGALTEQLYSAQVLGFYDYSQQRMVVVTDAGLDPQARITYAHEYTHALQDAAFGTGAAHDALVGDDDAALARLGLEEGDASVAMLLWGLAHLTPDQLLGVSETPLPDMRGIPAWMVQQLELPYLAGAEFVGQLYASGGWDAIDAAYADQPASTEQLLHPEKYAANETPIAVGAMDLAGGLADATGNAWQTAETTTLGEAMIGIWLAGIGMSQEDADVAAAGWGGDSLTLANEPGGGWAMALRVTWDTPARADEFEAAYTTLAQALPLDARLVRIGDRDTLVLQASSGTVLDAAAALPAP